MSDYKPIACALHEHYQFAVMQQVWLKLSWINDAGVERKGRVKPKDVYTRDQAEYLLAESEEFGEIEIRLDAIRQARWAHNGKSLTAR
ncbi:MAG: transcriptional antiterminator, Rof [Pseudomonadota bacterium]